MLTSTRPVITVISQMKGTHFRHRLQLVTCW